LFVIVIKEVSAQNKGIIHIKRGLKGGQLIVTEGKGKFSRLDAFGQHHPRVYIGNFNDILSKIIQRITTFLSKSSVLFRI
jgi:hypothetical protein